MILVDSSVWITYFNGQFAWPSAMLAKLLENEPILIGDLILTEVLQGFRSNKDFNKAKEFLSLLDLIEMGGYGNAVRSAANWALAEEKAA